MNWPLYKAQIIWWCRHGREKNPRKSPIQQWWTCEIYGFGHENYNLQGIRFVRKR